METKVQTIQDFSNENQLGLEFSKYDFANFFEVVNKGEKSYFNILDKTLFTFAISNLFTFFISDKEAIN